LDRPDPLLELVAEIDDDYLLAGSSCEQQQKANVADPDLLQARIDRC
jgi:hypothetical protein